MGVILIAFLFFFAYDRKASGGKMKKQKEGNLTPTEEEWQVLFSTLHLNAFVPTAIKYKTVDVFLIANFMSKSIKKTRDLEKTTQEVIAAFFS